MVKVVSGSNKSVGPLCRADEWADTFVSNIIWYTLINELAIRQKEIDLALLEDPDCDQALRENLLMEEGWIRVAKEGTFEA